MRAGQNTRFARQLRANSTDAEQRLWWRLRSKQLGSLRFRRQHPLGAYVVDFVCLHAKLIVEVDGGQHEGLASDRVRDAFLRARGFTVLRVWDNDVLQNLDGVCEFVLRELHARTRRPPP